MARDFPRIVQAPLTPAAFSSRREGLYHSHIDNRRQARGAGAFNALSPEPAKSPEAQELARLRAENKKLAAERRSAPRALPSGSASYYSKIFALEEAVKIRRSARSGRWVIRVGGWRIFGSKRAKRMTPASCRRNRELAEFSRRAYGCRV